LPKTDRAARQPVDLADDERIAAPKEGQRPIKLRALADAGHLLSKNLGTAGRLKVTHLGLEPGRLVRRRCPRVAD
jgi:hypothetical protein